MVKEKICGIYKITSPTGRIYIGQSTDVNYRQNTYKSIYKALATQPRIYNSLVKYGFENHAFEIIEECCIEDLNCRERFWQDYYDVTGENGLNCMLTKCDETKGVMPAKVYEVISKLLINIHTKEIYNSITHAAKSLNLNRRALSRELQRPLSNQTVVMFLSDYHEDLDFSNDPVDFQKRKVIRIADGKIFNSIREALKYTNLTRSSFEKRLRNTTNNDSGFLFLDDFLKGEVVKESFIRGTKIFNIETLEEFNSIKEASNFYGIEYSTLRAYLNPNSPRKNPTPLRHKETD